MGSLDVTSRGQAPTTTTRYCSRMHPLGTSGCVTRGTLLRSDWSTHVRVVFAAFKCTSTDSEVWTSFLGSGGTNEC
ncbi:hypothetical protein Y032_0001g8 [Ancylostoma ceylanicum]|uniref:Uncharacterized protein n=1 Tax=Ancylostoma ceylanicum TaxID=53326 RepID=A0A016W4Z7_9BILA|nr:hypothetical protein Y032_0001g8 [Ancylostoma ceylanicum]